MLSENDENKVWVHLYGGEQDGYRRRIELKTKAPQKFFIWRAADEKRIDAAKGKERMVLQNKLAVMAYALFDDLDVNGERELRYKRLETADKALADPAV